MAGMTAEIRRVVVGLVVFGIAGAGAYLAWPVRTDDQSTTESGSEETWNQSWDETEAEAEPPVERSEETASKASDDSSDDSDDESPPSSERVEANVESDETPTIPTTVDRIDETASEVARQKRPGQQRSQGQERKEYKPSVLQVVTNFSKADVTVNGLPYPEYKSTDANKEEGMVLPAGGPYTVEVTYDGKKKTYTLSLRPYEVRVLVVELSGFKGGKPPAPQATNTANSPNNNGEAESSDDDSEGEQGRVTVYSKPKGDIQVDGEPKGQKTPGTVDVSPGQHDIQVKFEDGNMSESKTVRVRKGSRIKLFFRKKD